MRYKDVIGPDGKTYQIRYPETEEDYEFLRMDVSGRFPFDEAAVDVEGENWSKRSKNADEQPADSSGKNCQGKTKQPEEQPFLIRAKESLPLEPLEDKTSTELFETEGIWVD